MSQTNQLADSTSPYLLQHADNPVNWYPWSSRAFDKAAAEDKPVFLSVGYATCHWCHVMAHESFENEQVAAILNAHYVAIKVDREQRPDVDEQYMLATQLMTQRGGWPNSVWLTPDGRPWFAGTYFPREDRLQHAGFKTVLTRLAEAWRTRRDEVEQQADQLAQAVKQAGQVAAPAAGASLDRSPVDQALDQLRQTFDSEHGGFGSAPKFPPHEALSLLISEYQRTGGDDLLTMLSRTLDAMACGGIHDHVGGGFHRYSTDAHWFCPHFEKMLYDNAQLLRIYARGYALAGNTSYRDVAERIVDWLDREMTDAEGGFFSGIDADSEGEEGRFYVWSIQQVRQVLGEDAGLFIDAYGLGEQGNWSEEATGRETGTNICHAVRPLDELAADHGLSVDEVRCRLADLRRQLLEVRNTRPRPQTDDKVIAAWNAMTIAALAEAAVWLDRPDYRDRAVRAGQFIMKQMWRDGQLLRSYRKGAAHQPGYLDDYAQWINALLGLADATNQPHWLEQATAVADRMIELFGDNEAGGFFLTSSQHDVWLGRSKNPTGGGNTPSGNGAAAMGLMGLARRLDRSDYHDEARKTLQAFVDPMQRFPQGVLTLVEAAAWYLETTRSADQESPGGPVPDYRAGQPPVIVDLFTSHEQVVPGQSMQLVVRLGLSDSWHIYAPGDGPATVKPLSVGLSPSSDIELSAVHYPPPDAHQADPRTGRPIPVYNRSPVDVLIDCQVPSSAQPGAKDHVVVVGFQACDTARCAAPTTHELPVSLRIAPDSSGEQRHDQLFAELNSRHK